MTGRHVLAVRLDSLGDVLLCGPAVRAIQAGADRVSFLAGPRGAAAALLLPDLDDVAVWLCPWISADPPPVDRTEVAELVQRLTAMQIDEAVIFTSFHQSALPMALLLRLAGVQRITAISDDYPGSLLDVRVASPADAPEAERMLAVCAAGGFELPPLDDGRLAIRLPPPRLASLPEGRYVVVHPGASAPARAYPAHQWPAIVDALADQGWDVVVTGSDRERRLTADIAAAATAPAELVHDHGGRHDLPELASVLQHADAVVVANTGPAHLAAAVKTPVVSLFAPVVPAVRWAPFGVPTVVLGDQSAPCRGSRARECPVAGHPCLSSVSAAEVAAAVAELVAPPERTAPERTAPERSAPERSAPERTAPERTAVGAATKGSP